MSVMQQVRACIDQQPLGKPFTPALLLTYGSRSAVDQALSRLAKAGEIERLGRGLFVRPEISRFAGRVMPDASAVAEALAERTGAVVGIHGAEAARRLGLSTQMSMQPVFNTTGPSRRLRVGNLEMRLSHVSPRKLALAGRPAGMALSALWYLGREAVMPETIEKLRQRLPAEEFTVLLQNKSVMPAWMSDAFLRFEQRGIARA